MAIHTNNLDGDWLFLVLKAFLFCLLFESFVTRLYSIDGLLDLFLKHFFILDVVLLVYLR